MKTPSSIRTSLFFGMLLVLIQPIFSFAQTITATDSLPNGTAIPVLFTKTVKAKTARPGTLVKAKTLQVVFYGNSQKIPKGAVVLGHVVQANPYSSKLHSSTLVIQFDKIETKKQVLPLHAFVRALANAIDASDAMAPITPFDVDPSGTVMMIGGDSRIPPDKHIYSRDGDEVGLNNKYGVFAELQPGLYEDRRTRITCSGTSTVQSVAIFSPTACGLYGFSDTYLLRTGAENDTGQINLMSNKHNVILYSGSAALLQKIGGLQQTAADQKTIGRKETLKLRRNPSRFGTLANPSAQSTFDLPDKAVCCSPTMHSPSTISPEQFERVVATVYGVCSPTGVFNVETRMRRLPHVQSFRFNLKASQALVDFTPGVMITESDIRDELNESGWEPQSIHVEVLPITPRTSRQ